MRNLKEARTSEEARMTVWRACLDTGILRLHSDDFDVHIPEKGVETEAEGFFFVTVHVPVPKAPGVA